MKIRPVYTKILIAAMLLLAVNISFGAFTGTTFDEHTNKFSLKNLGTFSKNYSLTFLKVGKPQYVGSQQISEQRGSDSTVQVQSMMRIQRGNTTFVYPYTYKFRTPKFKTPAPPPYR